MYDSFCLFFHFFCSLSSAFPEDAIAAVEKFQGKELAGRRLILEIAVFSGQSTKTEKDVPVVTVGSTKTQRSSQPTPRVEPTEKASAANIPGPSLQVIVCGVPNHVNKKMFKEIVQKVHHCQKLAVELVKEVDSYPHLLLT